LKLIQRAYQFTYSTISVVFALAALLLIVFAGVEIWYSVEPDSTRGLEQRFTSVLESIGLLTIAVAALELSQTILEEEVLRESPIGAPTRARRFLSRFMVVIIVALTIEVLVGVFEFLHQDPNMLVPISALAIATAALLAGWGVFIHLNRSAEELEPEALDEARAEDRKVESPE
jgi:hypothetical protein